MPDPQAGHDPVDAVVEVPGVVAVRVLDGGVESRCGALVAVRQGQALALHPGSHRAHRCRGVPQHLVDGEVQRIGRLLVVEADGSRGLDGPRIRPVEPREDPQQGGLARAVLADDAGDLARAHDERDVGQDAAVGIGARDPVDAQVVGAGRGSALEGVQGL